VAHAEDFTLAADITRNALVFTLPRIEFFQPPPPFVDPPPPVRIAVAPASIHAIDIETLTEVTLKRAAEADVIQGAAVDALGTVYFGTGAAGSRRGERTQRRIGCHQVQQAVWHDDRFRNESPHQ